MLNYGRLNTTLYNSRKKVFVTKELVVRYSLGDGRTSQVIPTHPTIGAASITKKVPQAAAITAHDILDP